MLTASVFILWVVVIFLAVAVLVLMRQVGVLHERIAPVGALMLSKKLEIGSAVPVFDIQTLGNQTVSLGRHREDNRSQLLFFLSPSCPICESLLPVLHSLRTQESGWLDVVLASDGAPAEHEEFVSREGLQAFPYILSTEVGMAYGVGQLPHAILIDHEGILRGQGLVNSREQVESLFEAMNRRVGSLKEFKDQQRNSILN